MLRNFNMVCILSDVNKIDPNLTFRSSRTPSVCQYKHQSLVIIVFGLFVRYFIVKTFTRGGGRVDVDVQSNFHI